MTIKTKLHKFYFDMTKDGDARAFDELMLSFEHEGFPKIMESWGGGGTHIGTADKIIGYGNGNSAEVELETEHLFDNQWNTAPLREGELGHRVFDVALDYQLYNKNLKCGYWLEQTDEMRRIRREFMACGYCGKQVPDYKAGEFCDQCLGSEYLKRSDLHLLRMRPVADGHAKRPELTESEVAELVPQYIEAQLHGRTERDKARLIKRRETIEKEYRDRKENAEIEYRGELWVLDNLPGKAAEPIYYTHTKRFGFGWNQPVDKEVEAMLVEKLTEFPYPYTIKCADGRTLSGER